MLTREQLHAFLCKIEFTGQDLRRKFIITAEILDIPACALNRLKIIR
jgi:hypothetical protein